MAKIQMNKLLNIIEHNNKQHENKQKHNTNQQQKNIKQQPDTKPEKE